VTAAFQAKTVARLPGYPHGDGLAGQRWAALAAGQRNDGVKAGILGGVPTVSENCVLRGFVDSAVDKASRRFLHRPGDWLASPDDATAGAWLEELETASLV
jgi:hypothetical protein